MLALAAVPLRLCCMVDAVAISNPPMSNSYGKRLGKQRLIRIAKLNEIRFHQRFVLQSRLEAQAALLLAEDCCSRVL
jgi:hypothetical protein